MSTKPRSSLNAPQNRPERFLRDILGSSLRSALVLRLAYQSSSTIPLHSAASAPAATSTSNYGLSGQRACSSCLREGSGRSNTNPSPCPRDHAAVPQCLCLTFYFTCGRTTDTMDRTRCLTGRAGGRGVCRTVSGTVRPLGGGQHSSVLGTLNLVYLFACSCGLFASFRQHNVYMRRGPARMPS
jgi:hypothetical protein